MGDVVPCHHPVRCGNPCLSPLRQSVRQGRNATDPPTNNLALHAGPKWLTRRSAQSAGSTAAAAQSCAVQN